MRYLPSRIEKKWRKIWEKTGIYKVKDRVAGKKNYYHLVMFPYPSGNLHIGHWYNFAPADVFSRFKKMQGYNVLSPIGFDAFGLPAENAAIQRKIHPRDWTYKNIKTMTAQLKSIGAIYDWSRQIITSDPEYYQWTQWMFLQLFKNGLVYRKKAPANWCPKCKTVLANEQVIDGSCERCDTEVIQKEIEQWLLKITDYAERLLKDLDGLDWPERTKIIQKNWIGKSEGTTIEFKILNLKFKINVFTTRLDTIFGCTYLVVAPEHEIISNLKSQISNFKEVQNYIKEAKNKSDLQRTDLAKEKTGVELKGIKAINPFNNEEAPIFVADYILKHYGTGAVMAVPAHDERDFAFAKKYKLPIKIVIVNIGTSDVPNIDDNNFRTSEVQKIEEVFIEDGILIDSGGFTGLSSEKAREVMIKWLEKNKLGGKMVNYKLRDWIVSRQRYWGVPIPVVYCDPPAGGCGIVAVPEKDLPVKLPVVKKYLPTSEGKSPLAHSEKFVNAKCPKCGSPAKRETDTMDTFVCSSWYYLRYTDPKNSKKFADPQKMKLWLPVNMYIGGAEHSVMHLLYARFFTKALYDLKRLFFKEPFAALRHQGTILGPNGQKMSKSRGNVIDPDDLVKKFGNDTVRMYLCFMGPYEQGGPWNPGGIIGIKRFLERIYSLSLKIKSQKFSLREISRRETTQNSKLNNLINKTIKKVTEDIENLRFNTAISALMILFNELEKKNQYIDFGSQYIDLQLFLKLLAPFAPHLAEELWQQLRFKIKDLRFKSIHLEKWPKYDPKLITERTFELIIQINGKMRGKITAPINITKEEAAKSALEIETVKKYVADKPKKIVFVPNKLINFVI